VRSAAGLAVRLGRPPAVGRLGRSSGRRPSDMIFPKDVQSDNLVSEIALEPFCPKLGVA
jgi:hypothetical protein